MNTSFLYRRLHWLNLPGMLLLMLLQRTPVLRLATAAQEVVAASPIAAILRSAFTAVAALGAMHSLAGATQFEQNPPGTISGTVGTPLQAAFTYTGTPSPPQSFMITGGSLPPGLSFVPAANGANIPSGTPGISGTPTQGGSFAVSVQGFNGPNSSGFTNGISQVIRFEITGAATAPPTITSHPSNQAVAVGASASFTVAVTGEPAPTIQWERNGTAVGTGSTLTLNSVQQTDIGVYRAVVSNASGSATSQSAVLGLTSSVKLVGSGLEFSDIQHPNGNVFDQILLGGAVATITADQHLNQITRMSYIDIDNDIVQLEFAGAGALSVFLEGASGPAVPLNYNQPSTNYMKGHATIVISGANETTNVSIFTVGRLTAFDPTGAFNFLQPISSTNNPANNGSSLFVGHSATVYDGFASIALLAISSSNGKFGGIRTSNTSYFATQGLTGIFAPGVEVVGPVFLHDINASGTATPVIMIGSSPDTRVTGGDLSQPNGAAVQVNGLTQLKFTAGIDSHGNGFSAKTNQGQLEQNGVNVTSQIVVNP